jgi:hypothetical protein
MMPLIVPLALDPENVSFQFIAVESPPLQTTVPVPICEAERKGAERKIPERERRRMMPRARRVIERCVRMYTSIFP